MDIDIQFNDTRRPGGGRGRGQRSGPRGNRGGTRGGGGDRREGRGDGDRPERRFRAGEADQVCIPKLFSFLCFGFIVDEGLYIHRVKLIDSL